MTNPGPAVGRPGPLGAKRQAHRLVSPNEGNEVRREGRRRSEHFIVPRNQGNSSRENPGEGRECQVRESLEGNMTGAQKPEDMSTRQQRIAERAKQSPEAGFTSLAHLMDTYWMSKAFARTRKDGAAGVDGQTVEEYVGDDV